VLEDDFTVDMQCDAEKTKCHLRSLAKNMQHNGWPLKYFVFCRVLWALNCGARGLNESLVRNLEPNSIMYE
jgi:hypothetical protein